MSAAQTLEKAQAQSNRRLEQTLPIVAKAIGAKHKGNLRIIVGGDKACTDGQIIYIPTLPLNNDALLLTRGYIDHEAAHIRFTNFLVRNNALTDCLEDIRIEDLISRLFVGAKQNLKALSEWYVKNGKLEVSDSDSDHDVLAKYVHFKLRKEVLQNNVDSIFEAAGQELLCRFGGNFKKEVDRIIKTKLRSTADCSQRAKQLRALLKKKQQEQQDQQNQQGQQNQDGQQGQTGQSGQSGALPEDSDQDESGQNESGQDKSGQDESGQNGSGQNGQNSQDEAGQDQSNGGSNAGGADTSEDSDQSQESPGQPDQDSENNGQEDDADGDDPTDEEMDANFQGVGEAAAEEMEKMSCPQTGDGAPENTAIPNPKKFSGHSDPRRMGLLHGAEVKSGQMRRKLRGLLEAKRKDRKKTGRSGKRFSSKNMHRLACKDTRVFTRKIQHKALNTAVHILLDRSDSMDGRDIELACEACYSMALALKNLQFVKLAVSAYSGNYGRGIDRCKILSMKEFESSLETKKFVVGAGGDTPTGEAMMYAAYSLAFQKEPRKIIFVVTDGLPNGWLNVGDVEAWLRRYGVEVFGIGIGGGSKDVVDVFRDSIHVDKVEDLADALFDTMQRKV